MKKTNNLIKILILCGGLFFASCETTDLDLTQNPNALSPVDADPDFYLNQIQLSYAYLIESFGNTAGAVTRIDYMRGKDYANAYQPGSFNGRWSSAYQTIMQDIREMNVIADEAGLTHHKGIGQFIEAHVLITLVDFFGDIPYTEAFQGAVNLNPVADSGASVYAVALGLLDSAIANFNSEALGEPRWTSTVTDPFYNGDWAAWTKAANTLKMSAYANTRLVDGSAVANFNAIVAAGNYITSNADDMQFRWGTLAVQPDSRHPRYRSNYTSTGGGDYMSNSLMDYMRGGPNGGYSIGAGEFYADPRIMFYYHRQTNPTPGIDGDANEEVLECGLQNAPAHYAGYVFCANPQGWWGRDHGN
ncbi:MAG: SusD/RagB family nutrient-binding outer membrane lipoprotein, partial [Flavobacteriaceae bacterium]|nr:SusD/RagB family nutrient-binding outer membrane lipoprotein [Flavobacteriaceae bacterium]